ncbi:54S ribosomal protein L20, mitochondrial [Colletotrichum spaethianum]|uniref:54S ribosomal protein L20, mitochondrial n=1 Tax=Colletotrichum spaethianum TaxID=700344 RepID=A0AA37LFM2_9PEZI|nr:54S ribosomal protein L20, mitochondrial [Colletotrichum spaethianum]GKT45055.1 54S ribosomal protein L20, mitochondrial [Colletotrichum spaethianum]
MEARTLTRPATALATLLRQQTASAATTVPRLPPALGPPPPREPLLPLRQLLGSNITNDVVRFLVGREAPPPALNVPSRGSNPRYHLSREDVAEIRRLRAEDPGFWSVTALARKFDCSETFITICTPAPREHKERLERKLEGVKSRWGTIRTKAREDRSRRKEMLFRGEL